MSDLIDRQAAIDELHLRFDDASETWTEMCSLVIDALKDVPSTERNKGEWFPLQSSTDNLYYQCSCCRRNAPMVETGCLMNRRLEALLTNFCPNCGADMKGEVKNERFD